MESVYIVWNPRGENPSMKHPSVDEARAEARRLAQTNPGQEFYVLRALESVLYSENPWKCRCFCKS